MSSLKKRTSQNRLRPGTTVQTVTLERALLGLFCLPLLAGAVRVVRGDDAPKYQPLNPIIKAASRPSTSTSTAPKSAANDFYKTKVQPILAGNCYACHGPSKQMARLRLDTKIGFQKGAESGPVVFGSDPGQSSLVQVLHYKGEVKMPPAGKLPDKEIDIITAWVKMGAPWPDTDAPKPKAPKTKSAGEKAAKPKSAEGKKAKAPPSKPASPPAPKPAAKKDDAVKKSESGTVETAEKVNAEKGDPQAVEFFETKIRPLLANNCYSCHGPTAQRAGLRLDSRAGVLKGSDGGPVVVENDPAKSSLVQVLHHSGKIKMPLGGAKLKAAEIEAIEAWVKMGAPWPEAAVTAASGQAGNASNDDGISAEQRRFWSFQPVREPSLPPVKNVAWAKSPLDRFVLARLENRGLQPNAMADRRTLIRRATYDLHGLLPTPAEVDAFVRDKSPDAWQKVVDRLLASPRYGERWGRHWLDVARYSDTKGYVFEEDRRYLHAYNYRDWVIRAFNEDLPYDQFITQQLAADRLPLGDDKRSLAALGYLTLGRRFLNAQPDIIDDRIDVTMRGFQGLSVSCARCHDHKFDPIPTKDYYSLYGVFASSNEPPPQPISPPAIAAPYAAHEAKVRAAQAEEEALIQAQIALLRERDKKNEALPDGVKAALASFREGTIPRGDTLAKVQAAFEAPARDTLQTLGQTLETLRKTYPPTPELAMTLADATEPVTPVVFRRGNPNNRGDAVPRRFLAILSKGERPAWDKGSGRLELARAIASPDNPLTARVMVNRVWLHHFGAGLVRTPSDFGKQGERPTHPELLDYLARRFVQNGWSVKKLHRLIMLSSVYQQSSADNPKNFAADPENRLLWRMNRRRLELESLRDSLLEAAGQLDTRMGGPSVDLWQAPFPARRTVYGVVERQNLPGIFRTFDFASPDATSPQRFRTTVPQQALFLMNSPFVTEQAQHLAALPELRAQSDDTKRINALYRVVFGRAPDTGELALGLHFIHANALSTPLPRPQAAWSYGYGFYDDASKRVTTFTAFAVFKDNSYRPGSAIPDALLRFVNLTANGGHPGADAQHAAIRRWTAPRDGTVSVKGVLNHASKEGDGVEARLVSSRAGVLGTWTAQGGGAQTDVANINVHKGETLDFVVSCRANDGFDSFAWTNTITSAPDGPTWTSNAQFGGPDAPVSQPLSAWARYAQALLMSNEFFFVD